MKKKICIIEDEIDIIRLLTYNLEREGYDVFSHKTGEKAFEFVCEHKPHLILLDLMIPKKDGFEVCRELKFHVETRSIPIIMLTAKTDEINIVTGLELGADDYVTKPFSLAVLIARIRAVLRREPEKEIVEETAFHFNDLSIYPDRYEVMLNGEMLALNHTEFRLLHCLVSKPGRVFSRAQLIDYMKGENYFVTERLVDVLLVSIRKKLKEKSDYIQTVRGVGYKFKHEH